jgi:hypothetical protein
LSHRTRPTLRFTIDPRGKPLPIHVEIGCFAHLTDLIAPSADEQALIAAETCCIARALLDPERQLSGAIGALAYSYTQISVGDAVRLLGFGKIMDQIESVTRQAGEALLAQTRTQGDRQARLLGVEHMLGWEPDPLVQYTNWATAIWSRLLVALLGPGPAARIVLGAALFGLMAILVGLIL